MTHSFPTLRSSDLVANLEGSAAQRCGKVDFRTIQKTEARRVDHQLHAVRLGYEIIRLGGCGQAELVAEAGAAAAFHRKPQNGGSRLARSEEHTSELQSLMRISYAVFCLKKKKTTNEHRTPLLQAM